MLTAYIDFKCAGSLLAIDPILALSRDVGFAIQWRAFSTLERDIPDTGAAADIIESHRATRARSRKALDQKYARMRGRDLIYPAIQKPADLALGALSQISGNPLAFISAAYDAHWNDHSDLDDPETVQSLLRRCGIDHSGNWDETRLVFAAAQSQAEEAGIVDAPAFVIDDQLFIGRQHLPWIEEIAREKCSRR
ncbi:MAG: hypothetical protein ABJN35_07090 [Erythrobacter sp.]